MLRPGMAVIVLWCILSLSYSGIHDFWGDEVSSLIGAREDLHTIAFGGGSDFHPPLYFIILHGWMHIFGSSEPALRSLSILCAGCAMMLALVLGNRLRLRNTVLPVLLIGISPLWIQFATMARYYSLSVCVFLIFLLSFLRAAGSRDFGKAAGAGIALAAAGYTNYIVFGVAFVVVVAEVLNSTRSSDIRNILLICVVALVLMTPLVSLVIRQTTGMIHWGESAQFAAFLPTVVISLIYPLYSFSVSETIMPWSIWVSVPGLCTIFFLLYRSRRRRFLIRVLVIGLLFGIGVMTIVARSIPLVYVPSRLLFLLPVWIMLVSEGYSTIRNRYTRAVIFGILILVNLYGTVNLILGREYHNSTYIVPWKSIVGRIRDDPARDPLVVTTEEYPLFHYGPDLRFQLVRPGTDVLSELESKYPAVLWLVERDRADPRRRMLLEPVERWLDSWYDRNEEYRYLPRSAWERKVREVIQGGHVDSETIRLTRYTRKW